MRTVVALSVFAALLPAEPVAPLPLTIVLDYERKGYSQQVIEGMKKETAGLLAGAGLEIDWMSRAGAAQKTDLGEIVVFKMRGKCAMDAFPVVPDELGMPFALTHSSDGQILSFGEVDCNRVRNATKAALVDFGKAEATYGRALGRVVAHEIYHMLARSKSHSDKGTTRECLSPRELTAERLDFPTESLEAIRAQIRLMLPNKNPSRPQSEGALANRTIP